MDYFARRAFRETESMLDYGEEIIMSIKQSLITDLAPSFVIATNKRIIIINNSFFGLYLSHNVFTPTDYNSIYYRQITSVVLVRGKIFESINIRLLGGFDQKMAEQRRTEGEIDGIASKDAEQFAKLVNKMVDQLKNDDQEQTPKGEDRKNTILSIYYAFKGIDQYSSVKSQELAYSDVLKLVENDTSKIVWLGSESADYISELLGVQPERIVRLDPDEVQIASKNLFAPMKGDIFVCYNGNISKFVTKYIKKEFGIEAYTLKGGVIGIFVGKRMQT